MADDSGQDHAADEEGADGTQHAADAAHDDVRSIEFGPLPSSIRHICDVLELAGRCWITKPSTFGNLFAELRDELADLCSLGTRSVRQRRLHEAAMLASPQSAAIVVLTRGADGVPYHYSTTDRFGSVGQAELIVGAPDENGGRESFTLQTPAANSYVYNELQPSC